MDCCFKEPYKIVFLSTFVLDAHCLPAETGCPKCDLKITAVSFELIVI